MQFPTNTLEDFNLVVNVSIVIFIVSFVYRFTNVEDKPVGVKPLTNLDEIFDLGNRKCRGDGNDRRGSYVSESKDAIPNKISGGTYQEIRDIMSSDEDLTGTGRDYRVVDIIKKISPTGPYNITVGSTLREREEVCKELSCFPGCQCKEFIPVPPSKEAFATLSSCTYDEEIGGAFFVGKSTFNIVPFISIDQEGNASSDFSYAFSMKDHDNAAASAATMVLACMAKGKRVLIAGSPTIPKYNEEWITDGSVDKQFIKVSPLELASKIEQLGDKGIDAITIIQKMVDLLFV